MPQLINDNYISPDAVRAAQDIETALKSPQRTVAKFYVLKAAVDQRRHDRSDLRYLVPRLTPYAAELIDVVLSHPQPQSRDAHFIGEVFCADKNVRTNIAPKEREEIDTIVAALYERMNLASQCDFLKYKARHWGGIGGFLEEYEAYPDDAQSHPKYYTLYDRIHALLDRAVATSDDELNAYKFARAGKGRDPAFTGIVDEYPDELACIQDFYLSIINGKGYGTERQKTAVQQLVRLHGAEPAPPRPAVIPGTNIITLSRASRSFSK